MHAGMGHAGSVEEVELDVFVCSKDLEGLLSRWAKPYFDFVLGGEDCDGSRRLGLDIDVMVEAMFETATGAGLA